MKLLELQSNKMIKCMYPNAQIALVTCSIDFFCLINHDFFWLQMENSKRWRIQGGARDLHPSLDPNSFIYMQFLLKKFAKQEWIPIGCVPSAAVPVPGGSPHTHTHTPQDQASPPEPGTPWDQAHTPRTRHPPCEQNSWHTPVKILPCPKLRLQAVTIRWHTRLGNWRPLGNPWSATSKDTPTYCSEDSTFSLTSDDWLDWFHKQTESRNQQISTPPSGGPHGPRPDTSDVLWVYVSWQPLSAVFSFPFVLVSPHLWNVPKYFELHSYPKFNLPQPPSTSALFPESING